MDITIRRTIANVSEQSFAFRSACSAAPMAQKQGIKTMPSCDRTFRAWLVLGFGLTITVVPGCGNSEVGTVAGRITIAGKPVPSGTVAFIPASGIPVCGSIDEDGNYLLEGVPLGAAIVLVQNNPAPRGDRTGKRGRSTDHTEVVQPPPVAQSALKKLIPEKYGDAATSNFRFDVKNGSNSFDIDLK